MRLEAVRQVLRRIRVFLNLTLCHWVSAVKCVRLLGLNSADAWPMKKHTQQSCETLGNHSPSDMSRQRRPKSSAIYQLQVWDAIMTAFCTSTWIHSGDWPGDLTLHYCIHYEGSLLLVIVSDPILSCRFLKPNFILIIIQEMNQSVSRLITHCGYKNLPCECPHLQNRLMPLPLWARVRNMNTRLYAGAVETKQPYVYSSLWNVHRSFTFLLCYALSFVMSFQVKWLAGIWFYFRIILKDVRFLWLWMLRLWCSGLCDTQLDVNNWIMLCARGGSIFFWNTVTHGPTRC